jgi:hypothetical protein
VESTAPAPPRLLIRPFGRPEGLRALAAVPLCAALATFLSLSGSQSGWEYEAPDPVPRWVSWSAFLLGVLAAAGLLGLARRARRRIEVGLAPPGSRRAWGLVTLGSALAVLGLLALRWRLGSGVRQGSFEDQLLGVVFVIVAGCLGWSGIAAMRAPWRSRRGSRAPGGESTPGAPYDTVAPRSRGSPPLVMAPPVRQGPVSQTLYAPATPVWMLVGLFLVGMAPVITFVLMALWPRHR